MGTSSSSSNKDPCDRLVPAKGGAVVVILGGGSSSPKSAEIPEKKREGCVASFNKVADTLCSSSVGGAPTSRDSSAVLPLVVAVDGGSLRLVESAAMAGGWLVAVGCCGKLAAAAVLDCLWPFVLSGGMVVILISPAGAGGGILTMGGATRGGAGAMEPGAPDLPAVGGTGQKELSQSDTCVVNLVKAGAPTADGAAVVPAGAAAAAYPGSSLTRP